ncbi:MAG: hypothetical protein EOO33_10195 [Comamonadaceae bacterium]|nr:MAG: hypothetical protein EOO33_10195 [Comamonadaceae bacterium]
MNHSQQSCSQHWRLATFFALCVAFHAASGGLSSAHAAATKKAGASSAATTATDAKKNKKTSNAVRIKNSRNDSGETTSERDRRLYRECKGLPNAGACRGYTQR